MRNGRMGLAAIWLALGGLLLSAPRPAGAEEEFLVVDVLVNVLKDVEITDETIKNIVAEANKILKQAGVKLEIKAIQRDFNDQGNNNDKIDSGEDSALDKKCVEELDGKVGKGKGYKVVFTDDIHGSATTAGLSPHDPDTPVTYINPNLVKGDEGRGNDLAHEFCHVFTLGRGHLIDDKDDTDKGNDERADDNGHAKDKKNLMYPYNDGDKCKRGTELTPDQIDKIKKDAAKRARAKVKSETSVGPKDSLHGSWRDQTDPGLPRHVDLIGGTLFAPDPGADLSCVLEMDGFFPDTPVRAEYQLLFDTDNNASTGVSFGGPFQGIDRVLHVQVNGVFPFGGIGDSAVVQLWDPVANTWTPLGPAVFERVVKISDVMAPPFLPSFFDIFDKIELPLPRAPLGPLADQVPVGAMSYDHGTAQLDEAPPVLVHTIPSPGAPEVSAAPLTVRAKDSVSVQAAGLSPGSIYHVLVDDMPVGTGTVMGDGTVATEVQFPTLPGGNYFLTVRDSTDRSDYTVLRNATDLPPRYRILGIQAGPTILESHIQDQDTGLKRIATLLKTNLQVTPPVFAQGTRNPVIVNAKRVTTGQLAQLKLKLVDMADKVFNSDATLFRLAVSSTGAPAVRTLTSVPKAKRKIRLRNLAAGLSRLDVTVNGTLFRMTGLGPNEERTLDVGTAMVAGTANTLRFKGVGPAGSKADVVLSN